MKGTFLMPAILVLCVCGCSPDSGELAKAKADADLARADQANARAELAKARADFHAFTAAQREASAAETERINDRTEVLKVKVNLMAINQAYHAASASLKRPPNNLEELKRFLDKDKSLVSGRDQQPFDFAWGGPGQPPALLAWEHTGDALGGRWIILRERSQPSYLDHKLFHLIGGVLMVPPIKVINGPAIPSVPIIEGPATKEKK